MMRKTALHVPWIFLVARCTGINNNAVYCFCSSPLLLLLLGSESPECHIPARRAVANNTKPGE